MLPQGPVVASLTIEGLGTNAGLAFQPFAWVPGDVPDIPAGPAVLLRYGRNQWAVFDANSSPLCKGSLGLVSRIVAPPFTPTTPATYPFPALYVIY